MRIILSLTTLAALAFGAAACNTVEGAGQDIAIGGEKLERAADENKGHDSRAHGY